jgi:hypothetical protein
MFQKISWGARAFSRFCKISIRFEGETLLTETLKVELFFVVVSRKTFSAFQKIGPQQEYVKTVIIFFKKIIFQFPGMSIHMCCLNFEI